MCPSLGYKARVGVYSLCESPVVVCPFSMSNAVEFIDVVALFQRVTFLTK